MEEPRRIAEAQGVLLNRQVKIAIAVLDKKS
jgi:hypothetical protein